MVSLLGRKRVVVYYGLGRLGSKFLNMHWVRIGWVSQSGWVGSQKMDPPTNLV